MKRRHFITLLGGVAAWPLTARAQRPGKPPTIGFMGSTTPPVAAQWVASFVQRLRELGWLEGRDVAIEYRWAEGRNERFAEIAAEFVRLKVDVILTHNTPDGPRSKAGHVGEPDRVRDGGRSGRQRSRRDPGATGRQRYRHIESGVRYCRQATRTLARGCPWSAPICRPCQSRQFLSRAGA